jgi:predicted nucleotidyltransferase
MKTGISDEIWREISEVFEKFPKICEVILFGSRAMGTYMEGSDIDLVVKGENIEFNDLLNIECELEDLQLLYKIDVLNYDNLNNADLKAHIDRVGRIVYSKKPNQLKPFSLTSS